VTGSRCMRLRPHCRLWPGKVCISGFGTSSPFRLRGGMSENEATLTVPKSRMPGAWIGATGGAVRVTTLECSRVVA
jgi:hypothetical protein